MSTDKATPRPWRDIHGTAYAEREVVNPMAQRSSTVAVAEVNRGLEEHEANAELIVRAVNRDAHFDEVVAALEDVLRTGLNGGNSLRLAYVAAGQKALTDDLLARAERSEEAVQRARKALAAVKGEK